MKRQLIGLPLLALAALLVTPAFAQGVKSLADRGEPRGIVVTGVEMPSQSIFSVTVRAIDGREIPQDAYPNGLWLKPGKHEIKAFGNVDLSWVRGKRTGRDIRPSEPIEIDVEEGMTYYLGLKADGRPDDWHLVVWKTEES